MKGKNMKGTNKIKRTSMAITATRKLKLERAAIDLSKKVNTTISWTYIVNFMIDNYTKNACDDLEEAVNETMEEQERLQQEYLKSLLDE
ncbi:hypothetical protein ACOZG6_002550 [Proteus mirabilis]|nr:hypothetical protein [Proteus mirabilis]EKU8704814.1 hypothetical protein [Proteus mirabilis]EKW0395127.1 hypothetical protein [Proteus mirabilis]EKX6247054.1 hypothetical protein [Proteus mirabilis]EKX7426282.1 hypothetical protein [Proteus mirabilis]ELB0715474.1 hypothetical protein [Proteus mirabilis]